MNTTHVIRWTCRTRQASRGESFQALRHALSQAEPAPASVSPHDREDGQ